MPQGRIAANPPAATPARRERRETVDGEECHGTASTALTGLRLSDGLPNPTPGR